MWMVEPVLMCDRHLLGEHAETHMHASLLAAPDTGYLPEAARSVKVDPQKSARDLAARCEHCRSALGT